MRTTRLPTSSSELDAAETEWWNRFGALSEQLWAFDEHTARALREPYIGAAAEFVGALAGKRVLDLGCGSGFLTRILAENGADVVGADVSDGQIAFAEALTRNHSHRNRIRFCVHDANALAAGEEHFDAVVAHAFLHHLAADELDRLLAQIGRQLLTRGGRAWFYEPVFFPPGRPTAATMLQRGLGRLSLIASKAGLMLGAVDDTPFKRASEFYDEAERLGYFLSPKELPFGLGELEALLERHLDLVSIKWVTVTSYVAAQWIANLRRPRARRLLALGVVRPLAQFELLLGQAGSKALYRGLPGYGFAIAECRARSRA